ncbi:hypothetical protein PF005_g12180 [Phytophthora fragariae]|uniref:Uncharacterized protein n=1 Tax=Phytophthora fragariae TaxID=53985 RepID=A0A6A3XUI8_9STRA|nr:hypothetical protein PF003_g26536 [Phytophthora fragariae]KAE8933815.1 hypothetical protein PF009_g16185 [Phytophthora fragariae]KAE9208539.1 hypothetical protein PF005_g12180 [Phytophthora fragariae]KAE9230483.1 hypothetical protein PF002_g12996 [Phytophthora fragariae]KAE9306759.1 hypothetical protein PF001_g11962 [Phytophthora fragariae]
MPTSRLLCVICAATTRFGSVCWWHSSAAAWTALPDCSSSSGRNQRRSRKPWTRRPKSMIQMIMWLKAWRTSGKPS